MPAKVKGFAYGTLVMGFLTVMLTGVSGWVTLQAAQVPSLQDSLSKTEKSTIKYRDRIEAKIDALLALQSEQAIRAAEAMIRIARCERDIQQFETQIHARNKHAGKTNP